MVRTRTRAWLLAAFLPLSGVLVLPAPAGAETGPGRFESPRPGDYTATVVGAPDATETDAIAGVLDTDPLGLVPKASFVRRYSLDTDHFEVWLCGNTGLTHAQVINKLDAETVPFFESISGDRHHLEFTAGGTVAGFRYHSIGRPVATPSS